MMKFRRKTAFLFLIIIFGPIILNKGIQVVRSSVWDGEDHITIAIDNGDLSVWSLEPAEKRVVEVIVPGASWLSLSSYGQYQARAAGRLSLLERGDGTLLMLGIEQTLAVPVDGVIIRKDGESFAYDLRNFFGVGGIGEWLQNRGRLAFTNLSAYDLFRLWIYSFSLAHESIKTIPLADSDVVAKTSLPDGTEGFTIDTNRFTSLALAYFSDTRIIKEQLTIEVVNATGEEGRANSLALLLTNIGANVINTASWEKKEDTTTIFASARSYTAEKIARITGGLLVTESPKEGRVDIRVVLGGEWH